MMKDEMSQSEKYTEEWESYKTMPCEPVPNKLEQEQSATEEYTEIWEASTNKDEKSMSINRSFSAKDTLGETKLFLESQSPDSIYPEIRPKPFTLQVQSPASQSVQLLRPVVNPDRGSLANNFLRIRDSNSIHNTRRYYQRHQEESKTILR